MMHVTWYPYGWVGSAPHDPVESALTEHGRHVTAIRFAYRDNTFAGGG